jgi:hypothetical protein
MIERLPASSQQTELSIAASSLHRTLLAELAEKDARIEKLTDENETLKRARVALDEWGIEFVNKLAAFVRETIKGGPICTRIEARLGDDGEATPLVWLWATTSEQCPEARLADVVAERDRLKASLSTALSGATATKPQASAQTTKLVPVERLREVRGTIEQLLCVQNGCPLPSYEEAFRLANMEAGKTLEWLAAAIRGAEKKGLD